jgi:hypothetical protein
VINHLIWLLINRSHLFSSGFRVRRERERRENKKERERVRKRERERERRENKKKRERESKKEIEREMFDIKNICSKLDFFYSNINYRLSMSPSVRIWCYTKQGLSYLQTETLLLFN